jgi:ribosomal peptide maturation radical SAM protein 1
MPFVALRKQPIGIPLVSGILKAAGMDVASFYFNFDLAGMMGFREYIDFTDAETVPTYFLQWAFAGMTWGWDAGREEEALAGLLEYADLSRDSFLAVRLRKLRWEILPRFMDNCAEKIKNVPDVSVVGFSCMFQHLPSLALGKMLRDALPQVKLIYGGSMFHGETGGEIFDKAEWIDALSDSEADDVLAEAFRRLIGGAPLEGLQGIMHRDRSSGKIYKTPGRYVPAEAFDNGVIPDMEGWFDAARSHGLMPYFEKKATPVAVPFESSRGCWWHEKSPCTFCGLNGVADAYRVKSPENVLKALNHYREKFGADRFEATDNNLSMSYFDTFLPALKETFHGDVSVYYNVKANLSRAQIEALAKSGITLALAGIENLSNRSLSLMRKGSTALQNVFFLKCARQYGIFLLWNLMLGSFGEGQDDIDENASLIPKITHLNPPTDPYRTVQVHRFSAYWRQKERYFREIGPAGWYKYIFPEHFDLEKIAYYFDVKPRNAEKPSFENVRAASSEWRRRWMFKEEPRFFYKWEGERVVLHDSRGERRMKIVLTPRESSVYALLDDIAPKEKILEKSSCPPEDAERILEDFAGHGLALGHGGLYLGLALREGFRNFGQDEKISVHVVRGDEGNPSGKLVK